MIIKPFYSLVLTVCSREKLVSVHIYKMKRERARERKVLYAANATQLSVSHNTFQTFKCFVHENCL